MADITITIPDEVLTEVVDALCTVGDWKASDGNRSLFAKQVLIRYVKRVTVNARKALDGNAATAAADVDATADLAGIT